MPTYKVDTIESYDKWIAWLNHNGYKPWQYQDDNGFRVWFWLSGTEQIELVTQNEEIRKRIVKLDAGL
jgi:hypothetical protein